MEVLGLIGGFSLVEFVIFSFIAMNLALAAGCVVQHSARRLASRDE